MKLTITLTFVRRIFVASAFFVILFLPDMTSAQEKRVEIRGENLTLRDAFRQIERQSGLSVDYNTAVIDDKRSAPRIEGTMGVPEAMTALLKGSGCVFTIRGSHIFITKGQEAPATRPARSLSGIVVTAAGEPISGATVTVPGTALGTISDGEGRYELNNVPDKGMVSVSFIGYKPVGFRIGDRTAERVVMEIDETLLDEIVVIGYGTLDKKEVTSAVTSLSGRDLISGVGGTDLSTALQGKISGMVIQEGQGLNGQPVFQLRGLASIVAGQEPLVVVDGFPGADIRSINQNDVKSIDILKDASAGAIYGTRAAAGVILITTKSGSDTGGKVHLTYSNEFQKKQNYRKPRLLTADEYVEFGIGTDYGSRVDWWDEMLNKGNFSHKHNISLTAGLRNAHIYASAFYDRAEGLPINEGRTDIGGRMNTTFKLFDDWLEIRANIDYRQAKRQMSTPDFRQAIYNNPTRSPYDPNSKSGYNVWLNEQWDYNAVADAMLMDDNGLDKWFKPEMVLKLNIKPVDGLSYQQTFGYENRQWEGHSYQNSQHREEQTESRSGTAALIFSKTDNINAEGYFSYMRDFKGGHSLKAVAGYSYFEKGGERFQMSNSGFSVDGIKYWDIGKGSYLTDGRAMMESYKEIDERLLAFFGRANYSFRDRYMASATFRREGSSKFGPDNRWGNFWAVSAGWRISGEEFMRNARWVDELKLRAGYGVTGNNNFDAAYTATNIGSDNLWMLPNGTWAYTYGRTEDMNPNLGWEEKSEWNLGLDYSFFKGRLYGKFDIFNRRISNMLFYVQVPQPPYIRGYQWQNIGSMTNNGWEFEIGGDIVRNRNFRWSTNLNLSANHSRVLSMDGSKTHWDGGRMPEPGNLGDAIWLEEGNTIGQFHLYRFAGFSSDGKFQIYNKYDQPVDASLGTTDDMQYVGNFTPKLMAGWSHTLEYKNFDLGIHMHSWIGFDVYNTGNLYFGLKNQGPYNVLREAYSTFDHIDDGRYLTDYYLEDGTFLKIDAVTLGYTLDLKRWTRFVNNLRVFFTVGNLATFTGYTGFNPEVNITGYDGGIDWCNEIYPMARTYTLGIQVNF